jgi:hypothetical protein
MVLILKFHMQTKFNHKRKFKKTQVQFLGPVNFSSSKESTGQSNYQKKHLILYILT